MEMLAYLHAAQEYEYPEEKEIDLNWVNRAAVTLLGVACATGFVNLGAAQAVTVFHGDDGADVTRLQDLLRNAGYFPIASTGYYGDVTEAAVEAFQRAKGLQVDGIAGDLTFKALQPAVSTTPNIPVTSVTSVAPVTPATPAVNTGFLSSDLGFGDSGTNVTRLQDLLRRAGYFSSPSTGFYGAATRDAVLRFQRANQISADGFAGRSTLVALESAPAASNASNTASNTAVTPVSNVRPVNNTTPIAPTTTATRPAIALTRPLQYGDSGAEVQALQKRLAELKYFSGNATGFYGEQTEAAVQQLQKAKNLEVDGIFGAKSAAVLR
jgi:peptidoglycan hydrolase-like protein with peptidoglycan-binding domain